MKTSKYDPVQDLLKIKRRLSAVAPLASNLPKPKSSWIQRHGDTPSRSLVKKGEEILLKLEPKMEPKIEPKIEDDDIETTMSRPIKEESNEVELENLIIDTSPIPQHSIPTVVRQSPANQRVATSIKLCSFARIKSEVPNIISPSRGIGPWSLSNVESTPIASPVAISSPIPTGTGDNNITINVPIISHNGQDLERLRLSVSLIVQPPTPDRTGWSVLVDDSFIGQWGHHAPSLECVQFNSDNVLDYTRSNTSRLEPIKEIVEKTLSLPVNLINSILDLLTRLFKGSGGTPEEQDDERDDEQDDMEMDLNNNSIPSTSGSNDEDDSSTEILFVRRNNKRVTKKRVTGNPQKEATMPNTEGIFESDLNADSDEAGSDSGSDTVTFNSCAPNICETDDLRFEDLAALESPWSQSFAESDTD